MAVKAWKNEWWDSFSRKTKSHHRWHRWRWFHVRTLASNRGRESRTWKSGTAGRRRRSRGLAEVTQDIADQFVVRIEQLHRSWRHCLADFLKSKSFIYYHFSSDELWEGPEGIVKDFIESLNRESLKKKRKFWPINLTQRISQNFRLLW